MYNCNCNRVICIAPPTEDRRRITKQSSIFPMSVGRLGHECFQLTTKSSGRPQQLQLCRQPVPCSRCSDSRFVDVSAARRGRRTTKHAVQIEQVHQQRESQKMAHLYGLQQPWEPDRLDRCRLTTSMTDFYWQRRFRDSVIILQPSFFSLPILLVLLLSLLQATILMGYPFWKPARCNGFMILVLYICFGK